MESLRAGLERVACADTCSERALLSVPQRSECTVLLGCIGLPGPASAGVKPNWEVLASDMLWLPKPKGKMVGEGRRERLNPIVVNSSSW